MAAPAAAAAAAAAGLNPFDRLDDAVLARILEPLGASEAFRIRRVCHRFCVVAETVTWPSLELRTSTGFQQDPLFSLTSLVMGRRLLLHSARLALHVTVADVSRVEYKGSAAALLGACAATGELREASFTTDADPQTPARVNGSGVRALFAACALARGSLAALSVGFSCRPEWAPAAAEVSKLLGPLASLRSLTLPADVIFNTAAAAALSKALPRLMRLELGVNNGHVLPTLGGLAELEELRAWAHSESKLCADGLPQLASGGLARTLRVLGPRDEGHGRGCLLRHPAARALARFTALEVLDSLVALDPDVSREEVAGLKSLARLQGAGFSLGADDRSDYSPLSGQLLGLAEAVRALPSLRALRLAAFDFREGIDQEALLSLLAAAAPCLKDLRLESNLPLSSEEAEAISACGALEAVELLHRPDWENITVTEAEISPYGLLEALSGRCRLVVRVAVGFMDVDELAKDRQLQGEGPLAAKAAELRRMLPRAAVVAFEDC